MGHHDWAIPDFSILESSEELSDAIEDAKTLLDDEDPYVAEVARETRDKLFSAVEFLDLQEDIATHDKAANEFHMRLQSSRNGRCQIAAAKNAAGRIWRRYHTMQSSIS